MASGPIGMGQSTFLTGRLSWKINRWTPRHANDGIPENGSCRHRAKRVIIAHRRAAKGGMPNHWQAAENIHPLREKGKESFSTACQRSMHLKQWVPS
ncbi:hypothetical protein [Thiohalomonas denitrificans]|uniref:hypothetical protein n=1 Tax=Thiohalomonas denitrificans TaxID=415747 RepID=UPI00111402FA|nr:hypothetical protein [Thiohalomonas denitrificans]